MREFDQKVVLVTGSSSGIGRAAALAFAREGAKVVVNGNTNRAGGEEAVHMIRDTGGDAIFIRADVSNEMETMAMVDEIVHKYGRLDCAYNNAGGSRNFASTAEYSAEDWDRNINLNLKGVWLCMKYEIPVMARQGKGAIVNCSSVVGLVGHQAGVSAYCAAKHGVIGLTKVAALEYAKSGIRVNALATGPVGTPLINGLLADHPEMRETFLVGCPMGRLAEPEEIAEAALWLCSDRASFITGATLPVDGGMLSQ